MKSFYQPRNFRHQLTELEGCAPRHSLKPEVRFGAGGSYSADTHDTASVGAVSTKIGPSFIIGGSNGVSLNLILIILAILTVCGAIWFFFFRRPRKN